MWMKFLQEKLNDPQQVLASLHDPNGRGRSPQHPSEKINLTSVVSGFVDVTYLPRAGFDLYIWLAETSRSFAFNNDNSSGTSSYSGVV